MIEDDGGPAAADVERAAATGAVLLAGDDLWSDLPSTARAIVVAAIDSFADRGFRATTLRHIAAGSGLSTAALYLHFRSKDDVLFEVSRRGHERALELVRAAATQAPAGHAFRTLVYAFSRWHAEQRTVARVVQYEFAALGQEHRDQVMVLRRATERVVRDVVAQVLGGVDPEGPQVRGAATAVLSLGVDVARWFTPSGPYTPDGIGRLYCELAPRMVVPARV
ncbi:MULTISPECIES: TetR/AcrR family transcriptional regulator [Pseudonocardia]|uniref:HTH-type transcriptional regulator MtrR n=2 Tax=Pseudonocardia TaxID=1847 RepID=A0A1Y2N7X2_PSEAH|nr:MULTISPECIES: TetR/AcrR family transcriptional regulator [Pseudonocardia]OSY43575.1 HTH-type transcriptional regulator MtrR [Pseudonocardia autotrophica]TDN73434.1 TetR family transcriptional regulator [Pseudonocardia autotrophica]BBG04173.1 TetR family transcriptional regulator [Pseudonocardia autotrophica]GEC25504.1 TetR family transcriptional regulator [Pseudonocardia saturnea]